MYSDNSNVIRQISLTKDLLFTSREMIELISGGYPHLEFLPGALTVSTVNTILTFFPDRPDNYVDLLKKMIRVEAIQRVLEMRGPVEDIYAKEMLQHSTHDGKIFRFWLNYFPSFPTASVQKIFLSACDNINEIICPKTVRCCIEAGVPPNGLDDNSYTAISLLVGNYISLDNERPIILKSIKYLLEIGVNVNLGKTEDIYGPDSIAFASLDQQDLVNLYRLLLNYGLSCLDNNLRRQIR
jgi:hypothetical protein